MSDTSIAIKMAGDDAQAHAAAITSDDAAWLKKLSDAGKNVRVSIPADADTEGHESTSVLTVLVAADDDDDVEGHALSLHFPSAHEANEFRRNLMVAGLLTATLAVGAAGGTAIGIAASGIDSNDASITISQYAPNLGQYDPANAGGTVAAAAQQATSLGQASSANMGGTVFTPEQAGQGQFNPANMGGTLAAGAEASSLGEASPANMGGTVFTPEQAGQGNFNPANMGGTLAAGAEASSLGEASPANMGGTVFTPEQAGQGQFNPANPGGTPQSDVNDEGTDGPSTPPGI